MALARKSNSNAGKPSKKTTKSASGFSPLEKNILLAKGLSEKNLQALAAVGVRCRADFATVGDTATLTQLSGASAGTASAVMSWALGSAAGTGKIVVESSDVVLCVSCGKKQPKDYKSGDLCVHCGKQAEPVFACYWCATSGPGRFCRSCGATFVSPGELELAQILKRDGLAKEEIPSRLSALSPAEKEVLWGRVHARR